MTDFRNRMFVALLVTGLVGVALVNMVVDQREIGEGGRELSWWSSLVLDAAVPIQKMVAIPFDLTRGAWQEYVAVLDVRDKNQDLRSRLADVQEENLQLREALVASGRLHLIDEMRDEFEIPMLPAELVGLDASAWFQSALIDRGRGRGVRAGMPVVSEHYGVVGLVTTTSRSASKIMMLLDRQSAVDGVVQRSRSRGVVRVGKDAALEFEFVARGGDVQVGDVIITSGLGGVYPKGFRLGEVIGVSEPGSGLLRTATVEPAVDFGRLEQVFVVLRRGPTMELLYATGDGDVPDPVEPPSS